MAITIIERGCEKLEILQQEALERKKNFLIERLIRRGIYKKDNIHLFELSLSDLENEYDKSRTNKQA